MERCLSSGSTLRSARCFCGAAADAQSLYTASYYRCYSLEPKSSFCNLRLRSFSDEAHLEYYNYNAPIRCSVGKKEKDVAAKKTKKRLKFLKGLCKDLSTFTHDMALPFDSDHHDALLDQVRGKMISEAAELLVVHLQKLRAEEKELKRKRKTEKNKNAAGMLRRVEDEMYSSSSSSESSDSGSECGEVIDMKSLKGGSITPSTSVELPSVLREATSLTSHASISMQEEDKKGILIQDNKLNMDRGVEKAACSLEQDSRQQTSHNCIQVGDISNTGVYHAEKRRPVVLSEASTKKIEVCVGGKCKKSGGAALLEEFQRILGIEGAVSGCKCMGKCKSGPNVRISDNTASSIPLFIGVGLPDVDLVIADFLGKESGFPSGASF